MKRQTKVALLIACGAALSALMGCTQAEVESLQAMGLEVAPQHEQTDDQGVVIGVYEDEEIG